MASNLDLLSFLPGKDQHDAENELVYCKVLALLAKLFSIHGQVWESRMPRLDEALLECLKNGQDSKLVKKHGTSILTWL